MIRTAWRQIIHRWRNGAGRPRSRRPWRPWFEVLEGRWAPAVTLSVSDPMPFPKPDSGQRLGMFVVTRSGDLAPAVQVSYQTHDGSGPTGAHAGVDYVATSGTLTFGPNQTTATIAVPVLGNNLFQADRTFTVSLSTPLTPDAFALPQTFAAGPTPNALAVGDFNGDGLPDLAVVNGSTSNQPGTVSVLLNTTPAGATAPTFAPPRTFAVGVNPAAVAVGDFNGDGLPDLAVTNSYPSHGSVSVLLNTTPIGATTPSFAPQQTFATDNGPNFYPEGVAAGDFNADGLPDLAVANVNPFGSGSVSVLINTTRPGATVPNFGPQSSFPVGIVPVGVAVGDVNGDGLPDLAVANRFSDTVSVLLDTTPAGSTVPSLTQQRTFAGGSGPVSVAFGDFNGDGAPDLAVADSGQTLSGPPSASVLPNTTPAGSTVPSFAPQQSYAYGSTPDSVAVGDVDGDGIPDLILANSDPSTVSVLLGNGDGTFQAAVSFPAGPNPQSVVLADLTNSGQPDVVVVNPLLGTASVLLNHVVPITLIGSPATGTISSTLEAPASITIVPGTNHQSATVGTAFPVPLAVNVRDEAGNPVQGATVIFTAPRHGPSGTFNREVTVGVMTDDTGRATAPDFVANSLAGSYRVQAQAAGGEDPIVQFHLTNVAAPAVGFQILAPGNTTSGTPFDVTVVAVDPYGNIDTNYQGTITFSTTDPDPGVVLPPDYTFQPGNAGQATFPGGVTLITPGSQMLTVTDEETGISSSVTINVM